MINLIKDICNWNKDRYEQEFDSFLTYNLLYEEVDELYNACMASDNIEQIDALVDIIYVAIGALWKMGFSSEQIYTAIAIICKSNNTKSITKTESHIKANLDKGDTYIPPTEDLVKLLKEIKE